MSTGVTSTEAHEGVESVSTDEVEGAGVRTLGIERWVQFSFILSAFASAWLMNHVLTAVWDLFAEPDSLVITLVSGIGSALLAVGLYRQAGVRGLVTESAVELSKSTWPRRRETGVNTVVVIVTSSIAAAILFGFDSAWSFLTGLIY